MAQIILEDLSAKADPKTQETRRLDSFRMLLHAALNDSMQPAALFGLAD